MSENQSGWKRFWHKIFGFLSGRMDDKSIRRLLAAFGSFLILGLGYLTTVITYYLTIYISTIVILDAILGTWIGFAVFLGVFIISFFGSTETLSEEDKAILEAAKKILKEAQENPAKVLGDVAAGLVAAIIDPEPEVIIE